MQLHVKLCMVRRHHRRRAPAGPTAARVLLRHLPHEAGPAPGEPAAHGGPGRHHSVRIWGLCSGLVAGLISHQCMAPSGAQRSPAHQLVGSGMPALHVCRSEWTGRFQGPECRWGSGTGRQPHCWGWCFSATLAVGGRDCIWGSGLACASRSACWSMGWGRSRTWALAHLSSHGCPCTWPAPQQGWGVQHWPLQPSLVGQQACTGSPRCGCQKAARPARAGCAAQQDSLRAACAGISAQAATRSGQRSSAWPGCALSWTAGGRWCPAACPWSLRHGPHGRQITLQPALSRGACQLLHVWR